LKFASHFQRLIDSSGSATKFKSIPKAKPISQSQLTSSKYANYYAVRPEIGRCKYMSLKTMAFWAMTVLQSLRDICTEKILHGNIKLGGCGKTVEIDELMFGHTRKYNRSRIGKGTWVFGMVERGTGRALAF